MLVKQKNNNIGDNFLIFIFVGIAVKGRYSPLKHHKHFRNCSPEKKLECVVPQQVGGRGHRNARCFSVCLSASRDISLTNGSFHFHFDTLRCYNNVKLGIVFSFNFCNLLFTK